MNTKKIIDNQKQHVRLRSRSTSISRHRKKGALRNKFLKANSLSDLNISRYTSREKIDSRQNRDLTCTEKLSNSMKEWRLWQALSYIFGWLFRRTEDALKDAELKVLQRFTSTSCWSQFIPISNHVEIRTLKFDLGFSRNYPAIVLLHGFASGLGVWSPCFDYLSQKCPVYALDLPGFGRSTRIPIAGSREDIECQYVCYLDEWRDAVGLENFILVGHGFGGYIATLYALKFPERTKHLVLAEPWGFTELPFGLVHKRRNCKGKTMQLAYQNQLPWIIEKFNGLLNFFHPFYLLRRIPVFLGKWIIRKVLCRGGEQQRSGINCRKGSSARMNSTPRISSLARFNSVARDLWSKRGKELHFTFKESFWGFEASSQYMYLTNMLRPTGVDAFAKMNLLYFWSKSPLIHRVQDMDPELPISFIYGASSVVDHKTGYEVYHLLPQSFVEVYLIQNAGHNTFIDEPKKFCDILMTIVESDVARQRTVSSSSAGAYEHEDLYWDCAWETLNLSQQNLYFPELEDEGDVSEADLGDWDISSYDFSHDEAAEKMYYLAPQINGMDTSKGEDLDVSCQDLGMQGFYTYQSSDEMAYPESELSAS